MVVVSIFLLQMDFLQIILLQTRRIIYVDVEIQQCIRSVKGKTFIFNIFVKSENLSRVAPRTKSRRNRKPQNEGILHKGVELCTCGLKRGTTTHTGHQLTEGHDSVLQAEKGGRCVTRTVHHGGLLVFASGFQDKIRMGTVIQRSDGQTVGREGA